MARLKNVKADKAAVRMLFLGIQSRVLPETYQLLVS